MPSPFSWFMYVPALAHDHDLLAVAHAWFAVLVLLMLAFLTSATLKRNPAALSREELIPDDRLTLRNGFELYMEFILSVMEGLLGHEARKYFWLIGTVFAYIFVSNLMGLLPGLLPPTENINTNLGVSIIVCIIYLALGLKTHGLGYLKHYLGPVWWLAPIFVLVEGILGNIIRPATLAVRLFGNINGDHIVLTIFSQLLPGISTPVLGLGIPIIFMGLGLFVCFMQAFVFSLLSTVYISQSVAHEH